MLVADDEADRERPEGAIETAIWANCCMLPSACRWPVLVATPQGQPLGQITVIICTDCGARLNEYGNPVG